MIRDFLDHLEDILENMKLAESFVEGISYSEFEEDVRTHYAVIRALEIVGEATKRLPIEVRQQYPDIPWTEMAGMRDRMIHGYDVVNLRLVWDTLKHRIPKVKLQIQGILGDHRD